MSYPDHLGVDRLHINRLTQRLHHLSEQWAAGIEVMSNRTDTHDLGFMIQPAFRRHWEIFGDERSLNVLHRAALSLATRYDSKLGAIRSWNRAVNKRHSITDMNSNFLVIVDSLCNLDLLFFVGERFHDSKLTQIARTHAQFVKNTLVRSDFSTFHVVNLDPQSGNVKATFTAQGYQDSSTWARGQAWAILGFTQTYSWTKDPVFLETAVKCAEYFLYRLKSCEGKHHHPYVPLWDFDAPLSKMDQPLRDSSAALIAALGMLNIYLAFKDNAMTQETCNVVNSDRFHDAALQIVHETLDVCLDKSLASLRGQEDYQPHGADVSVCEQHFPVHESNFDAILRHATSNNNPDALETIADHGMVYADYYFLEFGNALLRSGLKH